MTKTAKNKIKRKYHAIKNTEDSVPYVYGGSYDNFSIFYHGTINLLSIPQQNSKAYHRGMQISNWGSISVGTRIILNG
jgi:hypothetical protein